MIRSGLASIAPRIARGIARRIAIGLGLLALSGCVAEPPPEVVFLGAKHGPGVLRLDGAHLAAEVYEHQGHVRYRLITPDATVKVDGRARATARDVRFAAQRVGGEYRVWIQGDRGTVMVQHTPRRATVAYVLSADDRRLREAPTQLASGRSVRQSGGNLAFAHAIAARHAAE